MAQSSEAGELVWQLLDLPVEDARAFYRGLDARAFAALLTRARHDLGTPFGIWQRDPVGFTEDVLKMGVWSGQRHILESVRDHERTAVPASHAPGKTTSAAAVTLWWGSVWPVGSAIAVSTAPKLRMVRNILWPGIRRLHAHGKLAGTTQMTQWKVGEELIAYGYSASDHDPDAASGLHASHVLFVVDEAGGISHTLGRSYAAVLSNPHARLLFIGNPPVDEEGSWFEDQCEKTVELVQTIRIAAEDTPNFTGERTPRCTSCPPGSPPHRVAAHLTTREWAAEMVDEFGADSAFVTARVHAQFPTSIGQKVMPYAWVEAAADPEHVAAPGHWVRIGADIASDGGDEFVIAQAVGFSVSIVHRSSGAANADPVNLAGRITQAARDACDIRERLIAQHGEQPKVHVKIDASGMGWGVAGLVKRQCEEALLPCVVLPVRGEDRPNDETQFRNARSELWFNTRRLIKPETDPTTGAVVRPGRLKLVDPPTRLLAQLSSVKSKDPDSSGRIVVEKKADTKARIGGSPDLADAVNLATYEPAGQSPAAIEAPVQTVMPTRVSQTQQGGGGQLIPLRPSGR